MDARKLIDIIILHCHNVSRSTVGDFAMDTCVVPKAGAPRQLEGCPVNTIPEVTHTYHLTFTTKFLFCGCMKSQFGAGFAKGLPPDCSIFRRETRARQNI